MTDLTRRGIGGDYKFSIEVPVADVDRALQLVSLAEHRRVAATGTLEVGQVVLGSTGTLTVKTQTLTDDLLFSLGATEVGRFSSAGLTLPGASNIIFGNAANHSITTTQSVSTVGRALTISAGSSPATATAASQTGGAVQIISGAGATAVDLTFSGGSGGDFTVTTGAGGQGAGNQSGQQGGNILLTGGLGGNAGATGFGGGSGGAFQFTAGNGGTAGTTTGPGGAGGGITITTGNGGNASTGSQSGGTSGSLILTTGLGGAASAAAAAGTSSSITLSPGNSQPALGTRQAGSAGGVIVSPGAGGAGGTSTGGSSAGQFLTLGSAGGIAGTVSGSAGSGSSFSWSGGAGGAANTGTGAAGAGGAWTSTAGAGGAATTTGAAGIGGSFTLTAGVGGSSAASVNAAGVGGSLTFAGGAGGSNGGAGGNNGGGVTLRGGAATGAGVSGVVTIGATNTSAVNIGAASITTTISGTARVSAGGRPDLLFVDAGTARVGINRAAGTHGATLDVDNLAVAESILIARDNGTAVFTLANSGTVTVAPVVGYTGASAVSIVAGTQPDGHHALRAQTTYANADVLPAGVRFQLTTASGTTAINTRGVYTSMADGGYTGTGGTSAVSGESVAKGQGVLLMALGAGLEPAGNVGVVGASTGVTVGHNAGLYGQGQSSTARNYGVIGRSRGAAGTENIGVYGTAFASAGTPVLTGGYFTLYGQTDSILPASGALVCDNAGSTSPIFLARNNGVAAHSIDASGVLSIGGISPFDTTVGIGLSVIAQGPGLTAQPASQEIISYLWNFAGNAPSKVIQYNAGSLTNQRTFSVGPQTYAFTAASTITNAATVAVLGAPIAGTNATIVENRALWVQAGTTHLGGGVEEPKRALYSFEFIDDMVRTSGQPISSDSRWAAVSTGAVAGQTSAPLPGLTNNSFGISSMNTGVAATSGIQYVFGTTDLVRPNFGKLVCSARVQFSLLSTALQEYVFRFGFSNTAGQTAGTDYAMFEYNRAALGTDVWFTVTGNDGVNTSSQESAVAVNTWYVLRIEWDRTTASVQYYINDVLVQTQTGAPVPTNADLFGIQLQLFKLVGTTARTALVDFVYGHCYFNTER